MNLKSSQPESHSLQQYKKDEKLANQRQSEVSCQHFVKTITFIYKSM